MDNRYGFYTSFVDIQDTWITGMDFYTSFVDIQDT